MQRTEGRIALLLCGVAISLLSLVWGTTATVSADTTVTICGVVTGFTPATATVSGSIGIDGTTLKITPGTTINNVSVGANICLNASLNTAGEIILPATVNANPAITPSTCGVVSGYSAATATAAGTITISGVTYAIAPGATLGNANTVVTGANICLSPVFNAAGQLISGSASGPPTPGQSSSCTQLAVPGIVRGFNTGQDVFALAQPFFMTFTSGADSGTSVFSVTPATFGNTVVGLGGLPTLNPQGVSFSTRNAKLNLVSCSDSIWDVGFVIASAGTTVGDMVNIFLTSPDGGAVSVAGFTVEAGGLRLTTTNPGTRLFLDNRQTSGTALSVGTVIPFSNNAGTAGARTGLFMLNVLMDPGSPFNGCFQLGANIMRGAGTGTISLLFTDVHLMRNELPGDRSRVATGLLFGATGSFPTGLVCPTNCPTCPVVSGVGQQPQAVKCNTICFHSPRYFLLNPGGLPTGGTVLIPGFNYNIPVGVRTNLDTINGVLLGNGLFGGSLTPAQRFAQQYVTAQFNLINGSAGGGLEADVLWTGLSCYNLNFAPVTLSNGVTLSPDSMLKDLFMQATFTTGNPTRTNADLNALADIFALLNGNSRFGCNSFR